MLLLPRGVQTTGVHLPGKENKKVTKNQVKKGRLFSNQSKVNVFLIYHSARCFKSSLAFQCPEGDLICGQCLPPKVFFFIFSIFFIFFPPKVGVQISKSGFFPHFTYHLVTDCDCNIYCSKYITPNDHLIV